MHPAIRHGSPGRFRSQVNYRMEERTIPDMPSKAREAHEWVERETREDILGLRDVRWNQSTSTDATRWPQSRAHMMLSNTFGLEGPTFRDPNILFSREALPLPWDKNASINRKQLAAALENSMAKDKANTTRVSTRLENYVDPVTSHKARTTAFRTMRSSGGSAPAHLNGSPPMSPSKRMPWPKVKPQDIQDVLRLNEWEPIPTRSGRGRLRNPLGESPMAAVNSVPRTQDENA